MWKLIRDPNLGKCIKTRRFLIPLHNIDGQAVISIHNRVAGKLDKIKKLVGHGEDVTCPHCNYTSPHNYLGCSEFRCVDCERSFDWEDIINKIHKVLWPKG